jgi:membrane protease YdiL (CAAX protease family)
LSARIPLASLGITAPYSWSTTRSLLIAFTLAIVASIILFRCTGDRFLLRLLKMAGALLPATPVERCYFAAISVGAGITEELLFRGFLIWYLGFYFSKLTVVELIVISSILFGVCHLYQGVLGVIGTGVMGAVFASLYLSTGSLLLPATVHALVDMRILAILTPGRLRSLSDTPAGPELPLQKAGSAPD